MSNVTSCICREKPDFAVKAKELKHEIKHYLGIHNCGGSTCINQI